MLITQTTPVAFLIYRVRHTLCRDLLCGGWRSNSSTRTSCLKLNLQTGVFTPTSVYFKTRIKHQCWDVDVEGGNDDYDYDGRSTELVSPDGSSSSASFNLQYYTK